MGAEQSSEHTNVEPSSISASDTAGNEIVSSIEHIATMMDAQTPTIDAFSVHIDPEREEHEDHSNTPSESDTRAASESDTDTSVDAPTGFGSIEHEDLAEEDGPATMTAAELSLPARAVVRLPVNMAVMRKTVSNEKSNSPSRDESCPSTARSILSHVSSSATVTDRHDDKRVFQGLKGLSLQIVLGQTQVVKALLKSGSNVNERDVDGDRVPLHWAAARGKLESIELLLKAGVHTEERDHQGRTPAEVALAAKQSPAYHLLTLGMAFPDQKQVFQGLQDLSLLVALDKPARLKSVLRGVASERKLEVVNNRDSDADRYPLHWAAARGSVVCARLLLRAGADISLPDAHGRTPVAVAIAHNQHAVRSLFAIEAEANLAAIMVGHLAEHGGTHLGEDLDTSRHFGTCEAIARPTVNLFSGSKSPAPGPVPVPVQQVQQIF